MIKVVGMGGHPVDGGYGLRVAILEEGGRYWASDGRDVPHWPREDCAIFPPLQAGDLRDGWLVYRQSPGLPLSVVYGDRSWAENYVYGMVLGHLGAAIRLSGAEAVSEARQGLMGARTGSAEWAQLYDVLEAHSMDRARVLRERILMLEKMRA